MLLPIRTSIYPRKTPYLNYALIVINVIIFLLSYAPHEVIISGHRAMETLRPWAQIFRLYPALPYLWQFVTYAFLHASVAHIAGNMYFLYLFGNNVNDKLGNISYLCLYLGGAVAAAIGHALFNNNPVLGASGAVAAVTGAYMVLFPQTLITIIYWLFFIGTTELPALYFIAFKLIVWDNVVEPNIGGGASIAYGAHLAGYAFGIAVILVLLAIGVISKSQFDLWAMIKQWNRRRIFRGTVSGSYTLFTGFGGKKTVEAKEVTDPNIIAQRENIASLRSQIADYINQRNLSAAGQSYLELIKAEPDQFLPKQNQLDIANQLMSQSLWSESAEAYEKFINHYAGYEYIEQVQLMLGILYSRYLNQPNEAIQNLSAAKEKLSDPGQVQMCNDELDKLEK